MGGIVVQNGGTLAPGNSVGTLNVAGNVLFQAGSLFGVEVQASGSDKVAATGNAQLGGTLQVINLGGNYAINSSFVLLHADGGVAGTFAATDLASFGVAVRPQLIYTANEVQLVLAANQLSAVLGSNVALTRNQASALSRIDAAVLAGYEPQALSALYSLAPAAIPAALDAVSGQIYADATRAALEDERLVREGVLDRLGQAADLGLAGSGAWGQAIGSWGGVNGDGNGPGYGVDRAGLMMGIDGGAASDDHSWRAGLMGHYTRITVSPHDHGGRATLDRTGGGVYGGIAIGGWHVRAGLSLSRLELDAKRDIDTAEMNGNAHGNTKGWMFQSFGEVGYRIEAGGSGFVEPYLASSAARLTFDRLTESSGPVPLAVHGQKNTLGIAEIGLRGEAALGETKRGIRVGGKLGLRTAFGDRAADPLIALAAAPDQAFAVRSPEIARLSAAANLNLAAEVTNKLSLRVGYTGVQGSGMHEHGGRATVSLKF